MESKNIADLNQLYMEAVYGQSAGQQLAKREKDDNAAGAPNKKMVVTRADKVGNTPAYQNYKKGDKRYTAADHLKDDKDWGYDKDGNSLNPVDIEKKKKKDDDLAGAPKNEEVNLRDLAKITDEIINELHKEDKEPINELVSGALGSAIGGATGIGHAAGAGIAGAATGKKGRKVKKALGAGTGAAVGGALGGPVGAIIGGGVGGALADEVQHLRRIVERKKEGYDTVAAVIDYDRSKKGSEDADWDSEHGKKKQAKKERDYAAWERGKMKKDDPNWKHKKYHTGMHGEEVQFEERKEVKAPIQEPKEKLKKPSRSERVAYHPPGPNSARRSYKLEQVERLGK